MPQTAPDPVALYEARLLTLTAEHAAATARARTLRLTLLATAALAILLTALALQGTLPLRILLLPLAAALALLPLLLTIRTRLERLNRLLHHVHTALNRTTGTHPQSGHTGTDLAPANHLYSHDLQILGPNSLFGLLATTRTRLGRERLAHTLLHLPSGPEAHAEIRARQAAIRELAPGTDLREHLTLLGPRPSDEIPSTQINAWLDQPPAQLPASTTPLLLLTSTVAVLLLLAGLTHLAPWSLLRLNLAAVLALQIALTLRLRARVRPILAASKHLASQVALLTEGLTLLADTPVEAAALKALQANIATAAPTLARLNRPLALLEQRDNQYFFLPSLFLALGTHAAIRIDRWRSTHAPDLRLWLNTFAEFESLNALATYAFEHPRNTYPDILPPEAAATFDATGLRHPLLPDTAVPNNLRLSRAGTRFYLISGSNMAGKSTLLRALGTDLVLAQAGAPIPATSARLSVFTLATSIAISDSLADGKSKFLAEVERLHAILQATSSTPSPTPTPVLFLIDEIFSGTNSADRLTAAAAVLRQLIDNGAIGALSTHDLALTTLAQPSPARPEPHGQNVHMTSPDPADPLAFDYLLKPGINPSTNALAILRLIGIEP